ncbi:unnamed protein product [Amoebophrya sp. A120]|nr:unnamed protein product [Amoebophrya sp. A120]|eukprot:GSA120T00010457001.1
MVTVFQHLTRLSLFTTNQIPYGPEDGSAPSRKGATSEQATKTSFINTPSILLLFNQRLFPIIMKKIEDQVKLDQIYDQSLDEAQAVAKLSPTPLSSMQEAGTGASRDQVVAATLQQGTADSSGSSTTRVTSSQHTDCSSPASTSSCTTASRDPLLASKPKKSTLYQHLPKDTKTVKKLLQTLVTFLSETRRSLVSRIMQFENDILTSKQAGMDQGARLLQHELDKLTGYEESLNRLTHHSFAYATNVLHLKLKRFKNRRAELAKESSEQAPLLDHADTIWQDTTVPIVEILTHAVLLDEESASLRISAAPGTEERDQALQKLEAKTNERFGWLLTTKQPFHYQEGAKENLELKSLYESIQVQGLVLKDSDDGGRPSTTATPSGANAGFPLKDFLFELIRSLLEPFVAPSSRSSKATTTAAAADGRQAAQDPTLLHLQRHGATALLSMGHQDKSAQNLNALKNVSEEEQELADHLSRNLPLHDRYDRQISIESTRSGASNMTFTTIAAGSVVGSGTSGDAGAAGRTSTANVDFFDVGSFIPDDYDPKTGAPLSFAFANADPEQSPHFQKMLDQRQISLEFLTPLLYMLSKTVRSVVILQPQQKIPSSSPAEGARANTDPIASQAQLITKQDRSVLRKFLHLVVTAVLVQADTDVDVAHRDQQSRPVQPRLPKRKIVSLLAALVELENLVPEVTPYPLLLQKKLTKLVYNSVQVDEYWSEQDRNMWCQMVLVPAIMDSCNSGRTTCPGECLAREKEQRNCARREARVALKAEERRGSKGQNSEDVALEAASSEQNVQHQLPNKTVCEPRAGLKSFCQAACLRGVFPNNNPFRLQYRDMQSARDEASLHQKAQHQVATGKTTAAAVVEQQAGPSVQQQNQMAELNHGQSYHGGDHGQEFVDTSSQSQTLMQAYNPQVGFGRTVVSAQMLRAFKKQDRDERNRRMRLAQGVVQRTPGGQLQSTYPKNEGPAPAGASPTSTVNNTERIAQAARDLLNADYEKEPRLTFLPLKQLPDKTKEQGWEKALQDYSPDDDAAGGKWVDGLIDAVEASREKEQRGRNKKSSTKLLQPADHGRSYRHAHSGGNHVDDPSSPSAKTASPARNSTSRSSPGVVGVQQPPGGGIKSNPWSFASTTSTQEPAATTYSSYASKDSTAGVLLGDFSIGSESRVPTGSPVDRQRQHVSIPSSSGAAGPRGLVRQKIPHSQSFGSIEQGNSSSQGFVSVGEQEEDAFSCRSPAPECWQSVVSSASSSTAINAKEVLTGARGSSSAPSERAQNFNMTGREPEQLGEPRPPSPACSSNACYEHVAEQFEDDYLAGWEAHAHLLAKQAAEQEARREREEEAVVAERMAAGSKDQRSRRASGSAPDMMLSDDQQSRKGAKDRHLHSRRGTRGARKLQGFDRQRSDESAAAGQEEPHGNTHVAPAWKAYGAVRPAPKAKAMKSREQQAWHDTENNKASTREKDNVPRSGSSSSGMKTRTDSPIFRNADEFNARLMKYKRTPVLAHQEATVVKKSEDSAPAVFTAGHDPASDERMLDRESFPAVEENSSARRFPIGQEPWNRNQRSSEAEEQERSGTTQEHPQKMKMKPSSLQFGRGELQRPAPPRLDEKNFGTPVAGGASSSSTSRRKRRLQLEDSAVSNDLTPATHSRFETPKSTASSSGGGAAATASGTTAGAATTTPFYLRSSSFGTPSSAAGATPSSTKREFRMESWADIQEGDDPDDDLWPGTMEAPSMPAP